MASQTGPGGVGSSAINGLWLDANKLTFSNGDNVPTWTDQSGNSNDALQATTIDQPTFITSSLMNSYPALNFNGTNTWMRVADSPILDGTTSMSYYAVLRPRTLSAAQPIRTIVAKRDGFSSMSNAYSYIFFWNNQNLNLDIDTGNNRFATAGGFGPNNNYIVSFDFDGTLATASRSNISRFGSVVRTGAESSTVVPNSSSDVTIGILNPGDNRFLDAEYAELIHFNKKLNQAEDIVVNNYLSAKYNIPLSVNDIYAHDNMVNGDFDHDVAGIGRVTGVDIHDDSQGTGMVRINNPSGLDDGEFLFWGRDNLISGVEPIFSFDAASNLTRMNTKWRVTEIGQTGDFDFTLDLNFLPSHTLPGGCTDYVLIVDSQDDFNSTMREEYPLTISGTTAMASIPSNYFDDGDYFTIGVNEVIIYDGTLWSSGSGTLNRPDSTDSCKNLIVRNATTVTVPNDFHVNSITLEAGATLNIGVGNKVTVENELNLATGSILNLNTGAQLLQNTTGVDMNTGDGELIARQQGTGNGFNYNYWSSPVNVTGSWTLSQLRDDNGEIVQWTSFNIGNPDPTTMPAITLSSRWLYGFNSTTSNFDQWSYIGTTVPLLPGFGYTMKGSGTGTDYEYDFRGSPNNGDLSLTVASGGSVLVGNPYPSALDIDQFLSDNLTTTTGTAYFFEQFAVNATHNLGGYRGGYATRNMMMGVAAVADASGLTSGSGTSSKPAPDQFTAVAQGFFVEATGTTIVFNNAQRGLVDEAATLGSVFYSAPGSTAPVHNVDTRPKITFSFENPQTFKTFFGLGYDQRATYGVDNGFDAFDYNNSVDHMRWEIAGDSYIIQALQNIDLTDVLPLELDIQNLGIYKLSIDDSENIPSGMEVYLHDAVDGIDYPLHNQTATLNLPVLTNNSSRFSIRFQPTSTLTIQDFETEDIQVSYVNNGRYIDIIKNNDFNIDQVSIYSISGQLVHRIENPENQILLELGSGVYLVQLVAQNGFQVSRKILVQ